MVQMWFDTIKVYCLSASVTFVERVEKRDPQTIKTKIIHVFALFCMALFQLLLVVDLVSLFPYISVSAEALYWCIETFESVFTANILKKSRTNERRKRRREKTTRPLHMCEKKSWSKRARQQNKRERKARVDKKNTKHINSTMRIIFLQYEWICVCCSENVFNSVRIICWLLSLVFSYMRWIYGDNQT